MNPRRKLGIPTFQELLVELSSVAERTGIDAYVVGGAVRDYLLKRDTLDYDIVLMGPPLRYARNLLKKIDGILEKTSEFETARILTPKGIIVDLARARKEIYLYPGALPQVSPTESILEDLARRDFTINAMALSLKKGEIGKIIDPFSGRSDLKKRTIKVLYRGSFRDDPTRAIRAIRYSHRFKFSFHWTTEREFREAEKVLPSISFERIKNELMRVSEEENRSLMFEEIYKRSLLGHLPLVKERPLFGNLSKVLPDLRKEDWIYFFSLFIDPSFDWEEKLATLPLKRQERKDLYSILQLRKKSPPSSLRDIHILLGSLSREVIKTLAVSWGMQRSVILYLEKRHSARPVLTGKDLISMGIKKGPQIARILRALEIERLEGRLKTEEEERRFVLERFVRGKKG